MLPAYFCASYVFAESRSYERNRINMKHRNRLFYGFLILACILVSGAGLLIAKYVSERQEMSQADKAIDEIKEAVMTYEDEKAEEDDDPLGRVIDFDSLLAINSDVAFWLYIPDTLVDYPVMVVSDGNEYYMTHDINGDTGSWGSLFAYESSYDSDMSVVYGHHITGYKPAFGELENYAEQNFAEEHSMAYVYLAGSIEIYELYAVLDTVTSEMIYTDHYYKTDYRWGSLITYLNTNSIYENQNGSDTETDKLLMLSTCKEYATLKRYAIIFNRIDILFF